MKVLLPQSPSVRWEITSWSHDGDDVTIRVEHADGEGVWSCRVLMRMGTFLGSDGTAHGVAHGWPQIASMAVRSLVFETMPAMRTDEARVFAEATIARADELSRDRHSWQIQPLRLDGATYALFVRRIDEGVVAHADLGWATISMWSASELPEGPLEYVDVSAPRHHE